MKRTIAALIVVILVISAFAGCSIMGLFMPVTQEEVEEAFGLSFGVYIASALTLAFGGEIDGATLDEDTGQIRLSDVDITDDGGSHPYTSISGTFTPSDDESEIYANLSLKGGPVVVMRYTLTDDDLSSSLTSSSSTIEVVANYQSFEVSLGN